MFAERLRVIRARLSEKRTHAFLLINSEYSGQPGTRYLSGFSGSSSVLLITKRQEFIITDGRYLAQAKEEAPDFTLVPSGRGPGYVEFGKIAKRLVLRRFALDGTRTSQFAVHKLQSFAEGIELVDVPELLQEIRLVKSAAEIALIKKAATIACAAFKKLLPYVKAGATETTLAARLEFLMKEAGAERIAFETIVASGKNGAMPHGKPTSKKIAKGELITFDFGTVYRGYCSDITRTIAFGKPSAKLREIYETVRAAQELGCKAARAGMTGADLDAVCRNYIAKKGFGKYFLHSTGHGLGMEVHELPSVSSANKNPLPVGAVVTCEPGIYVPGLGGVRIEDDVVLTKNGNIKLS